MRNLKLYKSQFNGQTSATPAGIEPVSILKASITILLTIVGMTKPMSAQEQASSIVVETLTHTTSSWDRTPYKAYPSGQPQLTVLKITIPPYTTMQWHSHPLPNAGYVVSGELFVEKKDGTKRHFTAGQVIAETVDSVHRGISGDQSVVLIVFYPGVANLPLSQP